MKQLLLILFLLITAQFSSACGNEYGYTLEGKMIPTRYFFMHPHMRTFDTIRIQQNLQRLAASLGSGPKNHEVWSDIALNLMKLGKNDSAIRILRKIIVEHPDEYNLNANLGTAYELAGKNDSALKYISRGLELNPGSHQGSEWIHKKILEAKIKARGKNEWFSNNRIINKKDLLDRMDSSRRNHGPMVLENHFYYQISTRLPFTPAPDLVLSNLFLTLAEFEEEYGTFENAFLAYTYFMEFSKDDYGKQKVRAKILKLVEKRSEQGINELPGVFLWMMKTSKIDPQLLTLNIGTIEAKLDSMDQFQRLNDSLLLLNELINASYHEEDPDQIEDHVGEYTAIPSYMIAIMALVGGGFIGWFIRGRYKRKTVE